MQAPVPFTAGAELGGDYVIERALKKGGMGAVYVALQKSTGRRRALKLMHPQLASDARAIERFTREAKVGALIHSDHVVEVIGAGVDMASGAPWLSMELLDGEDLGERLARGPLPLAQAGEILRQVAHALSAAHAVGVVHRDLKPENVFLVQTRRVGAEVAVKVLDFGIAKVLEEASGTSSGVIGTPAYMAPEQSSGAPVTPAADVWAFALMAFTVLTGKAYWKAMHLVSSGPLQVLQEVATGPMEAPSARARALGVAATMPEGFDAWFAKATGREAAARFPDASRAWAALAPAFGLPADAIGFEDTVQAGLPKTVAPAAKGRGARRALEVACIAGLAIGAVALYRSLTATPSATPPEKPMAVVPLAPLPGPDLFNVEIGSSPMWGPKDALVTIIEFADFECPYSRSAEEALARIRKNHPDDIRLVWKHYPLAIHHNSLPASQFAVLAAEQGPAAFWKAHDTLFNRQDHLEPTQLVSLSKDFGLDPTRVKSVVDAAPGEKQVTDDVLLGHALALDGIPAFFVNGRKVLGTTGFEALVETELTRAAKLVAAGTPRAEVYAKLVGTGATAGVRRKREFAALPPLAYARGSSGADAVVVLQFCQHTEWVCKQIEPVIRTAIEHHQQSARLVWVDTYDAEDLKEVLIAQAAHSVRKAEDFWKLHDALMLIELDKADPLDQLKKTLREVAVRADVDLTTYDYGMRGGLQNDLKTLARYVKDANVTAPMLFIDGDAYGGLEPGFELETAITRAVEARRTAKP